MIITIPKEVPSQNKRERSHWAVQRREVKTWAACCRMLAPNYAKATKPQRVLIVAYRKRLISDHANLVGGCKGLVDGLVLAGLLVDDSTKWASFKYTQDLSCRSPIGRGKPCTVIEIEPAAEGTP